MTFQIRHDGKTYTVHTEVGEGLTRVRFDEQNDDGQRQEQPAADAHAKEQQHG